MAFTLVFSGNIRDFKRNPLTTETPFGVAWGAAVGDLMARLNEIEEFVETRDGETAAAIQRYLSTVRRFH